jgi:hypothetical protein
MSGHIHQEGHRAYDKQLSDSLTDVSFVGYVLAQKDMFTWIVDKIYCSGELDQMQCIDWIAATDLHIRAKLRLAMCVDQWVDKIGALKLNGFKRELIIQAYRDQSDDVLAKL